MSSFIFYIDQNITTIPVINTYESFTDLSWNQDVNTKDVTIIWSSFTRKNDSDGLSFNGWYQGNTTIDIKQFGGIPLNNVGLQFIMFAGKFSALDTPLCSWNMYGTFADTTLFNQDIGSWDVSGATNMASMFYGAKSFNQNISSWNVAKVTNMNSMFFNASTFNQNISSWNVGSVTNMYQMFYNAYSFNQDIGSWNYGSIYSPYMMITNCGFTFDTYSKFLQDLSSNSTLKQGMNFDTNSFYRYDDTATNTAYTYLTGTKGAIINDKGAYSKEELELLINETIPEIRLDASTNHSTIRIPATQYYTIITDSGGRDNIYGNNENYDVTIAFRHGVKLCVYVDTQSNVDYLKIYKDNSSGMLLYNNNNNNNNNVSINQISLSGIDKLYFKFTSNDDTVKTGFMVSLETEPSLIAKICFVKDTPVNTDQGIIPIDQLTTINTINGIQVKHITETISKEEYLIKIEKDSLYPNVPNNDTICSMNHKIMFSDKLTCAKDLPNAIYIKNTNEPLYNVLLTKYGLMVVNNMITETLHPDNMIAKLYSEISNYDIDIQHKILKEVQYRIERHKIYNI